MDDILTPYTGNEAILQPHNPLQPQACACRQVPCQCGQARDGNLQGLPEWVNFLSAFLNLM